MKAKPFSPPRAAWHCSHEDSGETRPFTRANHLPSWWCLHSGLVGSPECEVATAHLLASEESHPRAPAQGHGQMGWEGGVGGVGRWVKEGGQAQLVRAEFAIG